MGDAGVIHKLLSPSTHIPVFPMMVYDYVNNKTFKWMEVVVDP